MNWILENKEWIFSGIGATVIGIIITILFQKKNEKSSANKLKQRSGKNSTNIQIGGDFNNNEK